jgi:hypothetical protein
MAIDGTMYAYANPAATNTLFKSTDGGRKWTALIGPTGLGVVVDFAASPVDAAVFYVTDGTNIWKSGDAGATFTVVGALSGGGISSIDCARITGGYILVAAENTGAPEVYTYDESEVFPNWTVQNFVFPAGAVPVAGDLIQAAVFSPNFVTDREIAVVAYDASATDTYLESKALGAGWNGAVAAATLNNAATGLTAADIAFPDDYTITTANFVYVGTADGADGGNAYMCQRSAVTSVGTALGTAKDIGSIDVTGNAGVAQILAGGATAAGAQVYYSGNSGATWSTLYKPYLGNFATGARDMATVIMASDFATSSKAWIAYGGNEGGVSMTTDSAISWNQLSLINSCFDSINDLAINPTGTTVFLAGDNATNSAIWKYDGTNWERVYTGMGMVNMMVELSPDYDTSNTVFITNTGGTTIRRSTGGGATWSSQPSAVPAAITSWAVIDGNSVLAGDAAGNIYKTINNGLSWSTYATGAGQSISSIALSPNYATDSTIIVGTDGAGGAASVRISVNGGMTWLSTAISNAGMTNVQRVAFDADYANNATIYTTDDTTGGVYRCVYGTTVTWARVDNLTGGFEAATTTLGAGSVTKGTGIAVSPDGTLYVTDADTTLSEMVSRCLSPTASTAPIVYIYFENAMDTSTGAVLASLIPQGLWMSASGTDNKLWTIDTSVVPNKVYHYTDTLATEIILDAPLDATNLGSSSTASLSWIGLTGATGYTALVNTRSDFRGTAATISQVGTEVTATATGLSAGRTYYWRVRAASPVLSRYSETRTFITQLSTPAAPPTLAPVSGAQDVILMPTFGWGAVTYATSYELELTKDPTFGSGIMKRTSPTNALVWDTPLDYSTAYYWRVRAVTATGSSPWVTGVFTTMAEPTPPVVVEPTPPAPPAPEITLEVPAPQVTEVVIPPPPAPEYIVPGYIYAIIAIGGVLVIAVIVLIVRTRRVP